MAEVHIVGQIIEAKDFPKQNLFCKWHLQIGNNWKIISGKQEGQTQVTSPQVGNGCKWSFPLDIQLATAGLQGWPKIYVQVYHLDWLGRSHIFGYGFITVPTSPGTHTIDCYTWRPFGTIKDRFVQYFLGGGFEIKNPDLILSSGERYKLSTEAMGVVSFELCVVLRYLLLSCLSVYCFCLDNLTNGTVENYKTTTKSLITVALSVKEITPLSTVVSPSTCKDNSSSCYLDLSTQSLVTTLSPTELSTDLTTTAASVGSPTPNSKLGDKQVSSTVEENICICDLIVDYCDVNCCCDKDCTTENKLVFGHCEKDFRNYDTRACQYTKHVYINKTRHEFQINQNGLFCVVKSNLPPSYLVQRKDPLKNIQEAEMEKRGKYSWPVKTSEHLEEFPADYNYTFGKEMWVVRNNRLEKFQLPKSFIATNCLIKENIKYLIDSENSCSQTDISQDNYLLNADTYFKNLSIITNLNIFNATRHREHDVFQGCSESVCISISAHVCEQHFENCNRVNNSMNLTMSCRLSIVNKQFSCFNLVQRVRYDLHHNGTSGIIKADLFIILQNVSYTFGKDVSFLQTAEVKFLWWNHTLNFSSFLSGNPGYLAGKPILIANVISVNVTTNSSAKSTSGNASHYATELKLSRKPSDFTKHFLVLPFVNTDGQCILNEHQYTSIEFDYNLKLRCKIREEIIFHGNTSAERVCTTLQTTIFSYWPLSATNDTLHNLVVGQFGNANVNNLGDWANVVFGNDLRDVTKSISGEVDSITSTVLCRNITTLLKIDVFYARVDFDDIINQKKILAAAFTFGDSRNFTFPLDPERSSVSFGVGLETQAEFFDVTAKKLRKLVDPPSLNIRLPRDFFYPFVKIDNYAVRNVILKNLLMCSLFFVLLN